jgi:hypothetical protein
MKLVNKAGNAIEDFGGRFFEYKIFGKERYCVDYEVLHRKILKP